MPASNSAEDSAEDFDLGKCLLCDIGRAILLKIFSAPLQELWLNRQKRQKHPQTLIPSDGKTINTYFPSELLREIFLYSIESNQIKSGRLASVCRYWRSVITAMSHLWSTLRVGTWTETEQVATWLHRAYPKKVVIDTEIGGQSQPEATPFDALQDALTSTGKWHELTISSFPAGSSTSQPNFQVANPMKVLKVLRVAAGCVHSPSFAHLLNLVPTEAPISELRLHPVFSSTHFLQPRWFPVLQSLTVFIVNGRDVHQPFELLPDFTKLQIFEADRLPLPSYELHTSLPLLCTLQKLQIRASSVQWMAGRLFPCLEECAILLPHRWQAVQQHEVQLPSCRKFTYHGYPMTTVQYFHVPLMRAMDLRSHDCKGRRVNQQLRHLCTMDGRISKLTTLHLTLQCSERIFVKVLGYLGVLQELVLSTAYPSSAWQSFLESLVAKPSSNDWTEWDRWYNDLSKWEKWCSSRTWHASVLPHLKYLDIQCPKGFSQSESLDNCMLLRLVGWTRSWLTPCLKHLIVREGRGTTDDTVVDYTSARSLDIHLKKSHQKYEPMIVRGMITQSLGIYDSASIPLFQLSSTVLFRQLQVLNVKLDHEYEFPILPYLEQIKRLEMRYAIVPAYALSIDLPLIHTLEWLFLTIHHFPGYLGGPSKP